MHSDNNSTFQFSHPESLLYDVNFSLSQLSPFISENLTSIEKKSTMGTKFNLKSQFIRTASVSCTGDPQVIDEV
jgi:hypothetical protein